jgi:hypothetical protein
MLMGPHTDPNLGVSKYPATEPPPPIAALKLPPFATIVPPYILIGPLTAFSPPPMPVDWLLTTMFPP